jgi:hypothetical protein
MKSGITPAPTFRRIIGLDDRVFCRVKMFCCVPVWRLIAATDMATGAADPQNPISGIPHTPVRSEQRRGLLRDVCKISPCLPAALCLTQHASLLRRALLCLTSDPIAKITLSGEVPK